MSGRCTQGGRHGTRSIGVGPLRCRCTRWSSRRQSKESKRKTFSPARGVSPLTISWRGTGYVPGPSTRKISEWILIDIQARRSNDRGMTRGWTIVVEDEYQWDDAYCNGVDWVEVRKTWIDPIRGRISLWIDDTVRRLWAQRGRDERRHGTIRGQIRTTSKRG